MRYWRRRRPASYNRPPTADGRPQIDTVNDQNEILAPKVTCQLQSTADHRPQIDTVNDQNEILAPKVTCQLQSTADGRPPTAD